MIPSVITIKTQVAILVLCGIAFLSSFVTYTVVRLPKMTDCPTQTPMVKMQPQPTQQTDRRNFYRYKPIRVDDGERF